MQQRFVILSGCSGGGKSTLSVALGKRGFATIEEPGRRIVQREMKSGGTALPWIDPAAFARAAIAVAIDDLADAEAETIFFDRSLIDAASYLHSLNGEDVSDLVNRHRYHAKVFLTPPWPEIYAKDAERKHGFGDAVAEYERLLRDYPAYGYETVVLPKTSVEARVDFILDALAG